MRACAKTVHALTKRQFVSRLKDKQIDFFLKKRDPLELLIRSLRSCPCHPKQRSPQPRKTLIPDRDGKPYYCTASGRALRKVPFRVKFLCERETMWRQPIVRTPSLREILSDIELTQAEQEQIACWKIVVNESYKQCNSGWFHSGPDEEQPTFYHITIIFFRKIG